MIERFVEAQNEVYNRALNEINQGRSGLTGCGSFFLK